MLQAGNSRVRFPVGSLDFFFNLSNPSRRTIALGSTHSLTEMCTRNLHGSNERLARKVAKLTAICEPIFYKMFGKPRRLTTLWASTDCYMDSFIYTVRYKKLEISF
jgi:hypothetical protein